MTTSSSRCRPDTPQTSFVGFGRIEGRPVGIVANQPTQFAGCLDINASEKGPPGSCGPAIASTSRS